jgi:MFS family permease
MSGMTTAQSTIAADLNAYEDAMWFTSAYLIAMSSFGPLAGRLAAIFSPRAIILVTSCFFVIGGQVSSQAQSLHVFLLGRVLTGTGGAGVLVLSMILVLELTSKRTRGLFIGLVNSGFTTGVSLGAVVFGALIPVAGWVRIWFYIVAIPVSLRLTKVTATPFLDPIAPRRSCCPGSLL